MAATSNSDTNIKTWLKIALENENIHNWTFNVLGNSSKSEGVAGDVLFINAKGTTVNGTEKEFDFAVKCSKDSLALREKAPIKLIFENEMKIYGEVFPAFNTFQTKKGLTEFFESVPKFYGKFTNGTKEILVLENLKQRGYDLWNSKEPWPRENLEMVLREYGKLHAISAAMQDQEPELFHKITDGLADGLSTIFETCDLLSVVENNLVEVYHLLKNDLNEQVLEKWLETKSVVRYVLTSMRQNCHGLKVLTHGDSWNNNFLLKNEALAILDWQLAYVTSPIFDLSFFLFSCISKQDLCCLDAVLDAYYNSFSDYLGKLGSNSDSLYPRAQFLSDWHKYSKFGAIFCVMPIKTAFVEKEDIPDMVQAADRGDDVASTFMFEVQDKAAFKQRMIGIVSYVVENTLI